MQPDDAAVVARARDGDQDAFRLLVERHGRALFRLAFRMTGTAEDAEDVVQNTFIRAFERLDRFESRSNFATWLYRIGFNCAVDYLRAHPRRPRASEELDLLPAPAGRPHADDLVFASEIDRRVQQALGKLTAQERAAFLMRHEHGCSIQEICSALDVKDNAAKHAVFRAVKKLRAALWPLLQPADPANGVTPARERCNG